MVKKFTIIRSGEDAAAVALKVVGVINSNAELNESVVASSESSGVRVSALQGGQPLLNRK